MLNSTENNLLIVIAGIVIGVIQSLSQSKQQQITSEDDREAERHASIEQPAEVDLLNIYDKQIERYQNETRSRAMWSFVFAIVSMIAGFGFVIWGGSVLLTASEAIVLAAGGLLSTIGGLISGFITKTFLDVHKLSLNQLNRYFQQPVINDHILMAKRLSDDIDDPETRTNAQIKIIDSIIKLIDSKGNSNPENG